MVCWSWDGLLVFSILCMRSKQRGLYFAKEIIGDLLTKASDRYRSSPHTQPGEGAFASGSGSVCVCENLQMEWKVPRTFSCVVVDSLQIWEMIWATTLQLDMENSSVQAGNQGSILFFLNFSFLNMWLLVHIFLVWLTRFCLRKVKSGVRWTN